MSLLKRWLAVALAAITLLVTLPAEAQPIPSPPAAKPTPADEATAKKINGAKNATYTTVDPTDGCAWAQHDCGPNSEMFSFHGIGAFAVFADGHVQFIRETTSKAVLRALATRADGKNEVLPEL